MGEPVNSSLEALQRLSAELESGDIVFPTSIDVSLRNRQALENPDINVNEVCRLVGAEPVLSAKALRLANSVAYNRSGNEITEHACRLLGLPLPPQCPWCARLPCSRRCPSPRGHQPAHR